MEWVDKECTSSFGVETPRKAAFLEDWEGNGKIVVREIGCDYERRVEGYESVSGSSSTAGVLAAANMIVQSPQLLNYCTVYGFIIYMISTNIDLYEVVFARSNLIYFLIVVVFVIHNV
jgi:hypothetical protein